MFQRKAFAAIVDVIVLIISASKSTITPRSYKKPTPRSPSLSTNVQLPHHIKPNRMASSHMIDYLLSSQAPDKDAAHDGSILPTLVTNIALALGVIILVPALERSLGLIDEYTTNNLSNRQSFKAIFDAGHDLIYPALDSNTLRLEVQPVKATIATAVTVTKSVPTPVQIVQEQSTMGAILSIFTCLVLALVGTVLVFQLSRHVTLVPGTSPFTVSTDSSEFSPLSSTSSSDDDDADDIFNRPSGSGGRPPPVPIYDIFYDGPVFRVDKGVDTRDGKGMGDMDGAPPPPPPSFPTPAEDGDAFKRILFFFKWSSLTLLLSVLSFAINHLSKRFFKLYGKTQKKGSATPTVSDVAIVNEIYSKAIIPFPDSAPTVSEGITVNQISRKVMSLFPPAAVKPAIKPICLNALPLVESQNLELSILNTSPVSHRSREIIKPLIGFVLVACLSLLPFPSQAYIDHHIARTRNFFFHTETALKALDVVRELSFSFGLSHVLINSHPAQLY